jgi:hypothetical protein
MPNNTPNTYKQLFSMASSPMAPKGLDEKIMQQIERSVRIKSKIKGWSYATLSFFAITGCVWFTYIFLGNMSSSGFMSYISILTSDGVAVWSSWKELGLAMVESFPILSGSVTLALVIASLYSISQSFINIRSSMEINRANINN